MVGNWEASLTREQDGTTFPIQLSLTASGGKVFFPKQNCGGDLLVTLTAGKSTAFQEALTFNPGGCENGGTISLGPLEADGTIVIAEIRGFSGAMGKLSRSQKPPQIPDSGSTPSSTAAITPDDIISMVRAGTSDKLIIAQLRKAATPHTLSPSETIKLKNANVSETVIEEFITPGTGSNSAASTPSPIKPAQADVESAPAVCSSSLSDSSQADVPSEKKKRNKFVDFMADATKDSLGSRSGPKAVDHVGLRNILPDLDPGKSISTQFPHVGITVLKTPPMWGDLAQNSQTKQYFNGCFKLKARVWSDETHSKVIAPFDWCSPRDLEVEPMLGGMKHALLNSRLDLADRHAHYTTGMVRTEGPMPPDTLAPEDRETRERMSQNRSDHTTGPLSQDVVSKFGLMFFNVQHGLGVAGDKPDYRLWIVKICE